MAHNPKPWIKNDYIKNSQSKNLALKGQVMTLEKDFDEEKKRKIIEWNSFFRRYPSIFVETYFNIPLYAYQRYFIHHAFHSNNFIGIASRAAAKSFLTAIIAVTKATLYPYSQIIICSGTKKQAGLIVSEKIAYLRDVSTNLSREISDFICNNNDYIVRFHNGSTIKALTSTDNSRGERSTLNILEERRVIDTEMIDSVIRPFAVIRSTPFSMKPEFEHIKDEPQEIQISSAYYKSFDWFDDLKKIVKMETSDVPGVSTLFLDYLISIRHGIKSPRQMELEKQKLDPIIFSMEYLNIPFSESSSAYYKVNMFKRDLLRAWLPPRIENFGQKNPYDIPKKPDEKRIISVDVAVRAGKNNDNTIITCARLFPTNKGYKTEVVYVESMKGKNSLLQALRVKRLFDFFHADVLVLDIAGVGITLFDALTSITRDDELDKDFDAMTVMNHPEIDKNVYEDLTARTISLGKNAKPVIFPIHGSAQLNSTMAVRLRDRLKRKLISFLVDDAKAEDFLIKENSKEFFNEDPDAKNLLLLPYVNTNLLVGECVSLEMTLNNGIVKLEEPSGKLKDRYSSLAMLNYYVSILDIELLKQYDDNQDEFEVLSSLFYCQ